MWVTGKPMRDSFEFFRQAWSPRASWHLANYRYGKIWTSRLASFFWLVGKDIPLTGEAKSTRKQE